MLAPSPVCTRLLLAPKTPGVQIRKYHKVILNREREGIRTGGERGGEREKEGRGELSRKGRKGAAGMAREELKRQAGVREARHTGPLHTGHQGTWQPSMAVSLHSVHSLGRAPGRG